MLEYNCRFGDPEAQVILRRLETDLVDIIERAIDGDLESAKIKWSEQKAVCIILASGGYPGKYEKGKLIEGLNLIKENAVVFHAGTKETDGKVYTFGGRVLGVTSLGSTMEEARQKAYQAINSIHFDGMHYRKDIGL